MLEPVISKEKQTYFVSSWVEESGYRQVEANTVMVGDIEFFLHKDQFYNVCEAKTGVAVSFRCKSKTTALKEVAALITVAKKKNFDVVKTMIDKYGMSPKYQ